MGYWYKQCLLSTRPNCQFILCSMLILGKYYRSSVKRCEIFHTNSWYILRAMDLKRKNVNCAICVLRKKKIMKLSNRSNDERKNEEYSMKMARFYEIKSKLYLMMHSLNFRLANWCLILFKKKKNKIEMFSSTRADFRSIDMVI